MYVYEPNQPRDMQYYISRGFSIRDRGYGTKHWSEVFTILDERGNDMMEVRRAPRTGDNEHHTIYPDYACNLKLSNRYCYLDTAAWFMYNFIETHGYEIRRIYRLDICLDFKEFDSHDKPQAVMRRIVNHTYAKIYQANRNVHGVDRWNAADDHSISWGNKKSMVVTRLYNKSLELAQIHDKPWIRQAWFEAGLIENPETPIILDSTGKIVGDEIWRLEFQINSSARGWFVVDGDHKEEYVEHTLEAYWTRDHLITAFANLVQHYFDFRIYKQGKRKYDCKKKELFKFESSDCAYKLKNSLVERQYDTTSSLIIKQLSKAMLSEGSFDIRKKMEELVSMLQDREISREGYSPSDPKIKLLQMQLRYFNGDASKKTAPKPDLFEGTF